MPGTGWPNTPVVAVAGANDIAAPPDSVRLIATHVAHGRYVQIANAAHLGPAEQPDRIADLLLKLPKVGNR
jgi:3-oxoadipate enol-lactonase / 4-carboxymuconolactone decarboxylase